MEFKLWAFVLLVFEQGGLPRPRPGTVGYVLDAGANDGASAEGLARMLRATDVRVLAVEPLRRNVDVIKRRQRAYANMEVMRAGLGAAAAAWGNYPSELDGIHGGIHLQINAWTPTHRSGNSSYPILTIDSLFAGARTLLLAHLDLEGNEHLALPAANVTILRDRPIVIAETYPLKIPEQHGSVMAYFRSMRYEVYTVEEIVGGYRDGRNRVAIPEENRHLRWLARKYFHGGFAR